MSTGSQGEADRASWAVLLDEDALEEVENLAYFDNLADRIRAVRAPDTGGANLGAPASAVAAVTVLAGRALTLPLLEQVAPLLSGVIEELMPAPTPQRSLDAFWTLSYLNSAQCAGTSVPSTASDAEAAWLPGLAALRDRFSEPEQHTLALAASACRQATLVPDILGVPALPAFSAYETFGFNVQAFAMYLAAAVQVSASYEDVEPAWFDFVHRFPFKLDTEMLDWPALLWAARTVYATIAGLPVGEVGDEIHKLVIGA